MKYSIQPSFASFNRALHLSPHENIYTIALISIHNLYYNLSLNTYVQSIQSRSFTIRCICVAAITSADVLWDASPATADNMARGHKHTQPALLSVSSLVSLLVELLYYLFNHNSCYFIVLIEPDFPRRIPGKFRVYFLPVNTEMKIKNPHRLHIIDAY